MRALRELSERLWKIALVERNCGEEIEFDIALV
jgi:hypothetical protein